VVLSRFEGSESESRMRNGAAEKSEGEISLFSEIGVGKDDGKRRFREFQSD